MSIPEYIIKMKPSAYKSMMLAKYDKTKKNDGELKRWINEEWQNLTPIFLNDRNFYECGRKSEKQKELGLPSVCRASIKINEKTPKPLAKELTKEQIKKAIEIKKKGGRVNWEKL